MLTDEQITAIKTAITVFEQRAALGDHSHSRHLQGLLAAHNAGAQGEPYGWIGFDNDSGLNAAFSLGPAKPESWTYYFPLYAHPQPMPQTDAARDVLETAAVWLHASYDRPPQSPECKAMLARIDAEIERIDRAKGE